MDEDFDEFDSDGAFPTRQGAPLLNLQPGQRVCRFELIQMLGHGGMGQAWLAVDPRRKDEQRSGNVVLKFLPDALRLHPDATEEFRAEYRRVQALHHEHICPMFDLEEEDGLGCFQVMQFIPGITLRQLQRSAEPNRTGIEIDRVVRYLLPIAQALDYAHRQGIVHRDIKPENIIVDPNTGDVHVIDFGLAAELRTSMSRYSQERMSASGTEAYMAPEQWRGEIQDGKCDQWSLAILAWELLTGQLPFQGSGMQLGFAVSQSPVPELPDSLVPLQDAFERAMAKNREERFDFVQEFVSALTGETFEPVDEAKPVRAGNRVKGDDLASLLEKTQENVARKQAQAQQLVSEEYGYAQAAEILEQIPEHLRDGSLYTESVQKRDRVAELDELIRTAVEQVQLAGLREQVEELLELQPFRKDLKKLLKQLPKTPPKPKRPGLLIAPFDQPAAEAAQQAWAQNKGLEVEPTNSLGMKFRIIPPGQFLMGSPESEKKRRDDEHQHQVTLTQPSLLGVYPVTQAEWMKVMGKNPSKFKNVSGKNSDRFPVERVSWDDCQKFLKKLNEKHPMKGWRYDLPSEAEWEYACRAGTTTPFWFGLELNGKQANCRGSNPYGTSTNGPYLRLPSEVGSYAANPFGLYDMHGNVWEWCADWYDGGYYKSSPEKDPAGPTECSSRVLRGGAWYNNAVFCRSAYRGNFEPASLSINIGFRICCRIC